MPVLDIACVVEGHGERGSPGGAGAAEILVRRIAREIDATVRVNIPVVLRIPKGSLKKQGGIEDAVERAARKLGGRGAVLVLLDSDDEAREVLETELRQRAVTQRANVSVAVVAARCEFEAWFLAAAASLAGHEGLPDGLQPPPDPEGVRNAKGWLAKRMAGGKYLETLHQPVFTRHFDIQAARRAPSFEHCYQEIMRLVDALEQPGPRARTRE